MSLGIRGRLTLLGLACTSCVVALGVVAWHSKEQSKVFSPLYVSHIHDKDLLADILPPPAFAIEVYLATHQYFDMDANERPVVKKRIDELVASFEKQWEVRLGLEPDTKLRESYERARGLGREEIAAIQKFIQQVDSGLTEDQLDATLATVDEKYRAHSSEIRNLVGVVERRMVDREEHLKRNDRNADLALLGGSLATTLVLMVGCWLIGRSIIRPITAVANQLGSGADQVTSAASEVSAGAQRIAQGASEQAASLEETTASLEELSATCSQNANNARQANALAGEAAAASEAGENAARRAATEVNNQLQELAKAIASIRASTEKTTQVVESIDDIAIQINLLALNAAVEAARAGEAGLGFAVVADEVRNLAARSTEEAKNTSALIRESRASTERVHQVSQQVQEYLGRALDQDMVGNFQKLVTMVRKVAQLSAEVAAASDEQSKGVGQINSAVAQMDKVTQENAASAEQSAASSEEMQAQAVALSDGVELLNKVVGLRGSSEAAPVSGSTAHGRPGASPAKQSALPITKGKHSTSDNGYRPAAKEQSAAQMLPLTSDEASEHKDEYSRN